VLVTGAAGQIGQALAEALVADGMRPVLLDCRSSPALERLRGGASVLIEDLTAPLAPASHEALREVKALIHLAALMDDTDDVLGAGIASVEQNLLALVRLLQQLPSLEHLCFTSSMMVYGPPRYSPIDEGHPTEPVNTYGVMKLAVEHYLGVFGRQAGVGVAILRLCGLYGPGEYSARLRHRAIPTFIRRVEGGEPPVVYGDGSERRDYLFITDAVRAIRLASERRAEGTFNIGGGRGISVRELAQTVIDLFGAPLQPHWEPRAGAATGLDYTLDITRARTSLGFEPLVAFRDGLAREIAAIHHAGP
jgi:UDP-glucose 4-epimerase